MTSTRVLVVEDDPGLRDSVRLLFEDTPGFDCVGAYANAAEALEHLSRGTDLVLMDINLPGEPGSKAVARFRDARPDLSIVMLTPYDDEDRIFE